MENLEEVLGHFFRWVIGWSFVIAATGLVFRRVIKPKLTKDAADWIGTVLRIAGIINLLGGLFLVLSNFHSMVYWFNSVLLLAFGFGACMIGWGLLWLGKDIRSSGE